MSNTNETEQRKESVYNLYKSMDLSEEMVSDKLALTWLENHEKTFYGFVDGHWLSKEKVETDIKSNIECHKICDHFSGKHFCDVYTSVDKSLLEWAAKKSLDSFNSGKWILEDIPKILLNIANMIEKQQELFAVVESLSSGKHLHKVKTRDIPNLIESFKYYAGHALKMMDGSDTEWLPSGAVCVITEKYNNPLVNLSLRVSSLLASVNSVVLLTDAHSSMFAFLLAEICTKAGLPDGMLNVIPIDQDKFKPQDVPSLFSKLIFAGSYENSILYSKLSAKASIPFQVLIPRRPVIIVYESADLHSAANGVLEAFIYYDTRTQSGGCKVMVQESIEKKFLKILSERFSSMLVGSNLSKTDLSCIVTAEQKKILTECIEEAVKMKAKLFSPSNMKSENDSYINMLPTLLTDIETSPKLLYEELGGPIIVTTPFRTVKESISMFNCDNKGSPVSIWTEIMSVALEVSGKLKSGVVWVNSQNVCDPRIPFTGVYLSGNSVEGGKETILSHMCMVPEPVDQNILSSSNQSENKLSSHATERDVQNAVSSAASAQPKWETITDSQKRKILLDVRDKLMKKRKEFVTELEKVCKSSSDVCGKEVDETVNILYNWAMENDKYCEPSKEIEKNLLVFQSRNPLGVIGIQCPDNKPLLSFVSLVIPAVFYGNAVVALASQNYPTLALKMCEIFSAAKVPGGVINVVAGDPSCLIHPLRKSSAVNAVWYTDVPSENIYLHCNASQKLFSCMGFWNDHTEAKSLKYALESTYIKSIFLPSGDIFAN